MTRSVEERLRAALDDAGTAVAGTVEVPEWEWLSLPTLSPDPGAAGPAPGSPPRRDRRFDRRVVALGVLAVAAVAVILLATVPHDHVGLGVTSEPAGGGTHVATDRTLPVQTSSTARGSTSTTAHPVTSRRPAPVVVTTTTATTVIEQPGPTTTGEPPITTPSTVLDSIYKAALTPCAPSACQPAVSPDLYRPIVLPVVPAGQPCPVSTAYRTVTKDLNPVFGDDPVSVLGISSSGAVIYVTISDLPYPDRRTNPYWGGQYMGFVSAPHTGVALVRGRQLDGDAPMGFNAPDPHQAEGLSPYDEVHVDANPGTEWELTGKPGFRFKRPGCYGLQIDTNTGTTLIVFRAVGPVMVGG